MRGIAPALFCAFLSSTMASFLYAEEGAVARFPSWERLPPRVHYSLGGDKAFQSLLTLRHPEYQRFRDDHPGRWFVVWNCATGLPHRIVGDGVSLESLQGDSEDNMGKAMQTPTALDTAVRRFLKAYPGLFPVGGASDLQLDSARKLAGLTVLKYSQLYRGLKVVGSRCEARITEDGRLILIDSDLIPSRFLIGIDEDSVLSADEAVRQLELNVEMSELLDGPTEAQLVIVPTRPMTTPFGQRPTLSTVGRSISQGTLLPRLAWQIDTQPSDSQPSWRYYVAATEVAATGQPQDEPQGPPEETAGWFLGRVSRTSRFELEGEVEALATPGLLPDLPSNTPEVTPLANLEVWSGTQSTLTGPEGEFSLTVATDPAPLRGSLSGPFCQVQNEAGQELFFEGEFPTDKSVPIILNLSQAQPELETAQVNAFLHVNRAHEFIKSIRPDFVEIDVPVVARVNIDDECSGFFSPEEDGVLGFSRSLSKCANAAYSTFIYHEYGHFVVWKAFGDQVAMPGYNEGMADALATLMTDQPLIGESFEQVSEEERKPLRDLTSVQSHYPEDLLQEPHESGQILAAALWKLRDLLVEKLGLEAGRDVVQRLYINSLLLTPSLLSPDLVTDFLLLDDDDGSLVNGTPNKSEIIAAFADVGLYLPNRFQIDHQPLTDTVKSGPHTLEVEVYSAFDFVQPEHVAVYYSFGGDFYQSDELSLVGPGLYRGEIPSAPRGSTIRYYFEVMGSTIESETFPRSAPEAESYFFAISEVERVFFDDFDDESNFDDHGWVHGVIPNGHTENEDDWERGVIQAGVWDPESPLSGYLLDPSAAFSLPFHWGNDLAVTGTDNTYPNLVHNFLESPPISCEDFYGIHLRFRRCATAERTDRLRILVNDSLIYESPQSADLYDTMWRHLDYDVSLIADDEADVRVRFELESNSFGTAGGWNLDDVELVALGRPPRPRPEITWIEPTFDSLDGGALCTIRGAGFVALQTKVFFGAAQMEDMSVAHGRTITGTVPAGKTPGATSVTIETPGGTSTLADGFFYVGRPEIDSLDPAQGDVEGGVTVNIRGRFFTPATEVWFGARRLENLSVPDSESLVGVVPPGDRIGAVNVHVKTEFYQETFARLFTYTRPPAVSAIQPSRGPLEGGSQFTLQGNYFPLDGKGIEILFGDVRVEDTRVLGSNWIVGTIPQSSVKGAVDIVVRTPGGTAVLEGGFSYIALTIPVFIRSDVDLSGGQDNTDAILITQFLFLAPSAGLPCLDAADANDDGTVDLSDAVLILAHRFLGGPAPPPPFPNAGPDPTEDDLDCEKGLKP